MKEKAFRFIVTAMTERCPTRTAQGMIIWPVETLAHLADWPAGCGDWLGVGVCVLGTSPWLDHQYLRGRREGSDQT